MRNASIDASGPLVRPRVHHHIGLLALALLGALACDSPGDEDAGPDDAGAEPGDAAQVCAVDSECDDGLYCNGVETCGEMQRCVEGAAPDCDDSIACTIDRCVEEDRACASEAPDADGDGFVDAACLGPDGAPLGDDCDDGDAARFPGNVERCDAADVDEDCDPGTFGAMDADSDGYHSSACCNVAADGTRNCGQDCDDTAAGRSPDDPEVCNGLDDDCDDETDEELPILGFIPDCDGDGFGLDTAAPVFGCGPPPASPLCPDGGQWVEMAGDCDDTNDRRNRAAPEVCNGIDDDCNVLTDDIIEGTVVCELGEVEACSTSCGVGGTRTCSDNCLGFETCVATEVCNGCDDDGDNVADEDFDCVLGTSDVCTVPVCGTTGTRVCTAGCAYSPCTTSETCNYCDDDGDGDFYDERPFATESSRRDFMQCSGSDYALFGVSVDCDTEPTGINGDFELWATLTDGTTLPQTGAYWFTPADIVQGWGVTELVVQMDARVVPASPPLTDGETPIGGWSVNLIHSGAAGVGAAEDFGAPTGLTGLGAQVRWMTHCASNPPQPEPNSLDGFRIYEMRPFGPTFLADRDSEATDSCRTQHGFEGSAAQFGAGSTDWVRQELRLRYTPDDPLTPIANEESLEVIARTPGTGGPRSVFAELPTGSRILPVGTGPLTVGITAGVRSQTYNIPGPGPTSLGVPVETRVRVFHFDEPSGPEPPILTYPVNLSTDQICP